MRVRHIFWSMGATPEQYEAQLAKYAETVTKAGWAVEAGAYDLIITAKED